MYLIQILIALSLSAFAVRADDETTKSNTFQLEGQILHSKIRNDESKPTDDEPLKTSASHRDSAQYNSLPNVESGQIAGVSVDIPAQSPSVEQYSTYSDSNRPISSFQSIGAKTLTYPLSGQNANFRTTQQLQSPLSYGLPPLKLPNYGSFPKATPMGSSSTYISPEVKIVSHTRTIMPIVYKGNDRVKQNEQQNSEQYNDNDSGGQQYNENGGQQYDDNSGQQYNDNNGQQYSDNSGQQYNVNSGRQYNENSGQKYNEQQYARPQQENTVSYVEPQQNVANDDEQHDVGSGEQQAYVPLRPPIEAHVQVEHHTHGDDNGNYEVQQQPYGYRTQKLAPEGTYQTANAYYPKSPSLSALLPANDNTRPAQPVQEYNSGEQTVYSDDPSPQQQYREVRPESYDSGEQSKTFSPNNNINIGYAERNFMRNLASNYANAPQLQDGKPNIKFGFLPVKELSGFGPEGYDNNNNVRLRPQQNPNIALNLVNDESLGQLLANVANVAQNYIDSPRGSRSGGGTGGGVVDFNSGFGAVRSNALLNGPNLDKPFRANNNAFKRRPVFKPYPQSVATFRQQNPNYMKDLQSEDDLSDDEEDEEFGNDVNPLKALSSSSKLPPGASYNPRDVGLDESVVAQLNLDDNYGFGRFPIATPVDLLANAGSGPFPSFGGVPFKKIPYSATGAGFRSQYGYRAAAASEPIRAVTNSNSNSNSNASNVFETSNILKGLRSLVSYLTGGVTR